MRKWVYISLAVVALFVANIVFGSVRIPLGDVMAVIGGSSTDETLTFIILQSRLPQAITALLVGASLAVAGLLLQTAFHNPLAGPSVLGISGGASLGVALVTLGSSAVGIPFLASSVSVTFAALAGALSVTMLLLFLNTVLSNNLIMLITGLLIGYLISALTTILNAVATPESLHSYVVWGMGDFSSVSLQQLPLIATVLIVLMAGSMLMVKPLNAILLGDRYAENLGINISVTRNILLAIVGAVTAITTAFCGPVSFIGLAVPHIARMIIRTDNFVQLMPMTIVTGAATALLCNVLCTVPSSTVMPLNAVTPLIGVPVILYVIFSSR